MAKSVTKMLAAVELLSSKLAGKTVRPAVSVTKLPSMASQQDAPPAEEDPLLSAGELAVILKVHVATVHRWAKRGLISFIRVGRGGKLFRRSTALRETVIVVPAKTPATPHAEKKGS